MRRRWMAGLLTLTAAAAVAACSEDDPTTPEQPSVQSFTVATEDTVYVALGANQAQVVADPTSADWTLGLWQTSVFVNGDDGVVAYCVCQNANASDAEVQAMTAATELADFDAVTAAQIPSTGWSESAFDTNRWYRYNLTGQDHQIWPTFDVYLVRQGAAVFKLQILNYYNAAGEPRHVTFRYSMLAG